jgi:hypothetical protein
MTGDTLPERRRKELRCMAVSGLEERRRAILAELKSAGGIFDEHFTESDAWEYIRRVSEAWIESKMYDEAIGPDSEGVLDQIAVTARKLSGLLRTCRVNLSAELYGAVVSSLRGDDGLPIGSNAASAAGIERFAKRVKRIGTGMKHKRRVGRPTALSQSVIVDLARLYEKATGKNPPRGKGHFQQMVSLFMEAHGSKMNADYVIDLIQATLGPKRKIGN